MKCVDEFEAQGAGNFWSSLEYVRMRRDDFHGLADIDEEAFVLRYEGRVTALVGSDQAFTDGKIASDEGYSAPTRFLDNLAYRIGELR